MATQNNIPVQKNKYFVVDSKDITKREDKEDSDVSVLEVPIQSVIADRDGDVVNETGQDNIIEQLKTGKIPAFPNHGFGEHTARYAFEDIMGKWIDGEKKDGKTYGHLQLRKNNTSAEHLLDLVTQDMPVGFSIGFIPKEFSEDDNGKMDISSLDLLEVSPVGIPSNSDAVRSVTSSMGAVAAKMKSIIKDGGNDKDVESFLKNQYGDTMTGKTKEEQTQKSAKNEEPESETLESPEDKSTEEASEAEDSEKSENTEEPEDTESAETGSEKETSEKISADEVEEVMEIVKSVLERHMAAAMDEIREALPVEDSDDDEEGEEGDEEGDGYDEEEEDSQTDSGKNGEPTKSQDLDWKQKIEEIEKRLSSLQSQKSNEPKKMKTLDKPAPEENKDKPEEKITGYSRKY